ncbi:MAG: flagellar hook assembly protein FlgD [Burkholderiales bacterium]|nr:flagellar hook assembly protein FlgD [Burkholderiales bacterium]
MSTSITSATAANNSLSSQVTSATEQSDRFMKLLVAQMQNQDPLNPLDNAQLTSQMAQISTVSGLEKLNTTTATLGSLFTQMQAMQGAALVGRDVAVEGNELRIQGEQADGGFELAARADTVKVEILDAGGQAIDTIELKGLEAGRHSFDWSVPEGAQGQALTFKVTATSGDVAVSSMTLQHERISAVSTFNNTLALELANGDRVAYDAVWAFL